MATIACALVIGFVTLPAVAREEHEAEPSVMYAERVDAGDTRSAASLVRMVSPAVTEFDVMVRSDEHDRVVSFVSAFGAGKRARCEAIYLDESTWFAWCDVYDITFETFDELFAQIPDCTDCRTTRRYAVGASAGPCGGTPLGEVEHAFGPGGREPVVIQAAAEIATWETAEVQALRHALGLVGANGCPLLCTELIRELKIDTASKIANSEYETFAKAPQGLTARLDFERSLGLARWLDGVVNELP
jgi:hypothetical protein